MAQKSVQNYLEGSLWDKILLFALPLAASGALQQLFNAADIAVVGRFVGPKALAAVGATGPIINLFVNLFIGLSIGSNVVIANAIGSKNSRTISRGVHTSILVAVLSGFFLAATGFFCTKPLLEAMSTPEEVLDLTALYMRIFFLGMPFMMLYNFAAAILRSKGDTRRPFYVLLVSGIVNVLLNLFFVVVCGMSVEGVAIATVIANALSSISLLYFLMHESGPMHFEFWKLRFTRTVFGGMARIGLPAGLQGLVFSLSNIIIQSAINSLGAKTVAASAAALTFEYFAFFLLSSFSQACTTIVGQNFGAKKFSRCKIAFRDSLILDFIGTGIISILLCAGAETVLGIFTDDPEIIAIGKIRMQVVLSFEIINVLLDVTSSALRGMGHSLSPAIACIAGVCVFRVIWVASIFKEFNTFFTLMAVYPISWAISALAVLVMYFRVIRQLPKNI